MAQYTVRKRSKFPLVLIEIFGLSIYIAFWLCKRFNWDWIVGVGILIASLALIGFLFFGFRIFRYLFSIVFSLLWGLMAYFFALGASKSGLSHWVAFIIVFIISLMIHKNYFNFETNSEKIDVRGL